jgi:cAMP phosphodiesterase
MSYIEGLKIVLQTYNEKNKELEDFVSVNTKKGYIVLLKNFETFCEHGEHLQNVSNRIINYPDSIKTDEDRYFANETLELFKIHMEIFDNNLLILKQEAEKADRQQKKEAERDEKKGTS